MPTYAVFFTFRPEAVQALVDKPSDRAAVVAALCESAGATMRSYYLMLGSPHDGFTVVEAPDSATVAAVSLAVTGTGAFSHLETHELIESSDLGGILGRAGGLTYSAPGT
ncbi:GYD domain-containing protein [Nocardioides cynanchi]|uniref:GYD domain-containing protein n=1 Tax=Nocardioides cynanchi TaxID=2558918 RepID=UPI001245B6EF|nr:GYD domain-containing protein [Nocardioides cynanchi]